MTPTPVGQPCLAPATNPAPPSASPPMQGSHRSGGSTMLGLWLSMVFSSTCLAHGIHQHGLAHLELSQQDELVSIHFRVPLDSLIGFEGRPANDEQRAQAKALLEKLQQAPDAVFQLPPAAQCTLNAPPKILEKTLSAADAPSAAPAHDAAAAGEGHDHEHDEHDDGHAHDHHHEHHHAHDHDHEHEQGDHDLEHKQGDHVHADGRTSGQASPDGLATPFPADRQTGHAQQEPHDHEAQRHDDDDDDPHSDLSAEYEFRCQNPTKMRSLQLTAFKHWPRIHAVDTAVVTDHGQKAARLKAQHPRLSW
ncbi:MAG: DUF2796 domain-containing protein [Lautropia sp.]|nr:DUF2796 domain-containing protein [Lautropia sp.]